MKADQCFPPVIWRFNEATIYRAGGIENLETEPRSRSRSARKAAPEESSEFDSVQNKKAIYMVLKRALDGQLYVNQ